MWVECPYQKAKILEHKACTLVRCGGQPRHSGDPNEKTNNRNYIRRQIFGKVRSDGIQIGFQMWGWQKAAV